jgi:DNA repair photolyase
MDWHLPAGRASRSNASSRYDKLSAEPFDDEWDTPDDQDRQMRTSVTPETIRTIISYNESPDLGFDRTINPYRGCEHGCIYCYARPTHAYVGLSPGLDFETKLFSKPDAAAVLEAELRKPSYVPARIQLGACTDPYQPIEKRLEISRAVLQVLDRFNHPVGITTKNALVVRDVDILSSMAKRGLVYVAMSITTMDRELARSMEPRASTPSRRIWAMKMLSEAGVPVIAGVAPVIPGLTDHELEDLLERSAAAGAVYAYHTMLRMPLEIKSLFREWLEAIRPNAANRVISLTRQIHGGQDYDTRFHVRMKGTGPIASITRARFQTACKRLNLTRAPAQLRTDLFVRPPKPGDQMTLF